MERLRVVLIVYWVILLYFDLATILNENGSLSLPFSLAGRGDFESLLRAAFVSIIFGGIGVVGNYCLIRRRARNNQKTSQQTPI